VSVSVARPGGRGDAPSVFELAVEAVLAVSSCDDHRLLGFRIVRLCEVTTRISGHDIVVNNGFDLEPWDPSISSRRS
jgi:hypothetical protein